MPSFGVSKTSPKNSLALNMSPTSATIFIKCRNCQHMKNNIGYKGNTNNTSVVIFLKKLKVENSQRYYFAWENLRGFFCCCWSSFHFCIFMSFLIFILLLLFICRCSSFTFAFRHHPSPLRGLSLGFYTHFILSAQSIAEWFATISFSTIPLSSYRERYGFEWVFLPTGVFLPSAPSSTFYLRLSRPPWELAVLPRSFQGFILILETQTRSSVCLIHNNP